MAQARRQLPFTPAAGAQQDVPQPGRSRNERVSPGAVKSWIDIALVGVRSVAEILRAYIVLTWRDGKTRIHAVFGRVRPVDAAINFIVDHQPWSSLVEIARVGTRITS